MSRKQNKKSWSSTSIPRFMGSPPLLQNQEPKKPSPLLLKTRNLSSVARGNSWALCSPGNRWSHVTRAAATGSWALRAGGQRQVRQRHCAAQPGSSLAPPPRPEDLGAVWPRVHGKAWLLERVGHLGTCRAENPPFPSRSSRSRAWGPGPPWKSAAIRCGQRPGAGGLRAASPALL